MTDAVTTLHIAPRHFWLIVFLAGLIALSLLALAVLRQVGRKVQKTPWDHLSNAALTGWITAGLLWSGLLLLAIHAAYRLLWPWQETVETASAAGPATLGAGALVVALLGAPWVIWGTWLKHRTVAFQKEGHMTDRISKAVEQLGAVKTVKRWLPGSKPEDSIERTEPNIEIRIGGLLSLERIAEDSMRFDRCRDHIRIMKIICAYIRQNSPHPDPHPDHADERRHLTKLDIQVAIDVLRKRSPEQRKDEVKNRYRLDLRMTNLNHLDLSDSDFSRTIFSRSSLSGALFKTADLNH